ncbi:hypothetical protein [uncultured Enterococcus sp.]|uniref:hypothetical protein n=1 Tax=uncultured Enterococcus sp. TaxID=167972 RepID=UPI002AA6DC3F|nr:hypothetical protein [uncultured Enterococcus sp.]
METQNEDKNLLWEVGEVAEEFKITIAEFFEILKWIDLNFAPYKDIDADIIERISVYDDLNQAMKKIVDTDYLEELLSLTTPEFVKYHNMLILEESQKVVQFESFN